MPNLCEAGPRLRLHYPYISFLKGVTIFSGYFDLSCQMMMVIAMLKAHTISLYQTLHSKRLYSATGVLSF